MHILEKAQILFGESSSVHQKHPKLYTTIIYCKNYSVTKTADLIVERLAFTLSYFTYGMHFCL